MVTRLLSLERVGELLGCDVSDVRILVIEERRLPAVVTTLIGHQEPLAPHFAEYVDETGRIFTGLDGSERHKGYIRVSTDALETFALENKIPLQRQPRRGAPWPAYEPKRLEALRLAAARFLANFDPGDRDTAPKKEAIVRYLVDVQGIPESVAPHMASILLPDTKRGGRPPSGQRQS